MIDITELYSLLPVWMTLTFTQSHMLKRKNMCNHSVVKWHTAAQTIVMVAYLRKMTAKKPCQNGKGESLWHFLSLFCLTIVQNRLSYYGEFIKNHLCWRNHLQCWFAFRCLWTKILMQLVVCFCFFLCVFFIVTFRLHHFLIWSSTDQSKKKKKKHYAWVCSQTNWIAILFDSCFIER